MSVEVTDEVDGQDEEFVHHLTHGADNLGRGELDRARVDLERALALRPRDPKVLGLLGQAYYRQGKYEQAAVAWQRLVDDNPVEAGARVNLGLACLKARRFNDAVRQLQVALDLQPGHRKAMGYLGLTLLEAGDAASAREWFAKAGSDQMVARCDELLAARADEVVVPPHPSREPVQALSPLLTSVAPDRAEAPAEVAAEGAAAAEAAEAEGMPAEGAPAEAVPTEGAVAEGAVEPGVPDAPGDASPGVTGLGDLEVPTQGPAPTLAAWAASRVVAPPAAGSFQADGPTLAVAVRGELRCRLDGMMAWRGELTFSGEMKRFRGRATDKPFGAEPEQVHRVVGEGMLLVRSPGRRFTVLDLGGESGFFREAVVFGFEEPLAFENGRLAAQGSAVDLVHLRGAGRVALRTAAEPLALQVLSGTPVRVPAAALVGWVGALTPRLVPPQEGGALGASVELAGEGTVLADDGRGGGAGT